MPALFFNGQSKIKTRQLFLYGRPSTQKTLLVSFLSKVLRVYFGSSRRNDFTGADNYYDLWVFDQFHKPHFYGYSNSEPSGDSVLDYDMTLALRTRFFGSLTDGNAVSILNRIVFLLRHVKCH